MEDFSFFNKSFLCHDFWVIGQEIYFPETYQIASVFVFKLLDGVSEIVFRVKIHSLELIFRNRVPHVTMD